MAENPSRWQRLRGDLWFFGTHLLAYEAVIVLATLIVCALGGWLTVMQFSLALLAAGALVFSIGPFAMLGGWSNTRSFQYLYGQSMNADPIARRAQQDRRDMQRNTGLLVPSIVLGSLTMILATLVQAFLG